MSTKRKVTENSLHATCSVHKDVSSEYQALHEEYNKEIPANLITGDTAPERVKEVKKTGIEVMYKPIEPDVLKRNILKLLNNA